MDACSLSGKSCYSCFAYNKSKEMIKESENKEESIEDKED